MTVGVLALQGDFADHAEALARRGVDTVEVRTAAGLEGLSGLVLPGGESTTLLKLLKLDDMYERLRATIAGGLPTFATCAGLVLVATRVEHPEQDSLGLVDITVVRNGYGRQIHSGTVPINGPGVPDGCTGVFIRAPKITAVGDGVEVLARRGEDPVLVRQGNVLGCCFHPEMERTHPVIDRFVEMVGGPEE